MAISSFRIDRGVSGMIPIWLDPLQWVAESRLACAEDEPRSQSSVLNLCLTCASRKVLLWAVIYTRGRASSRQPSSGVVRWWWLRLC